MLDPRRGRAQLHPVEAGDDPLESRWRLGFADERTRFVDRVPGRLVPSGRLVEALPSAVHVRSGCGELLAIAPAIAAAGLVEAALERALSELSDLQVLARLRHRVLEGGCDFLCPAELFLGGGHDGDRIADLLGELLAADDGGDVDHVVGQGALEDVAGFGEGRFLGDDVESVLVATAGGADVEVAVAGRAGDEGDAGVGGVALEAVGGGGVPEADVLLHVLRRQGRGAVSVDSGHGEGAVVVGRLDEPELTVADGFVAVGAQVAVVAAGDDDVAGARCLGSGDTDGEPFVDVADAAPEGLDGVVEGVDVLVALRADGQPATVEVVDGPGFAMAWRWSSMVPAATLSWPR